MRLSQFISKISILLIASLIFVTPANLFYKFAEGSAYNQGLLIDYLIPKIYLSDILILALIFLIGVKRLPNFQINKLLPKWRWPLILFALVLLRQLFTPYPIVATWLLVKSMVFFILIAQLKKIFSKISRSTCQILLLTILGTMVFQTSLGTYQFYYQKPLAKYQLLGESNLAQPTGIAYYINASGAHRVLAYGTTSHPNILAGVMVVYLWLILEFLSAKNYFSNKAGLLIKVIAIWMTLATLTMTRSWTGWLTLLLCGLLRLAKLPKIRLFLEFRSQVFLKGLLIISFILIPSITWLLSQTNSTNFSFTRRNWLNHEAVGVFFFQPIFGVGIGQFVTKLSATGQNLIGPAFIQPVHHVGLLILAETGLLGVAFMISVWKILDRNQQIALTEIGFFLMIIASLDHYLLTSQTGWLLIVWLYVFNSKKSIANYSRE